MKLKLVYLSCILLLLFGQGLYCNQGFRNVSIKEGLPGTNVTTIFQDSYGYIWLGIEEEGLVCCQGRSFISYNANASDSSTISNNYISKITEDHKGNLWIGTENGLSFFHRSKRRFYNYYLNNTVGDLNNNITSVCVDGNTNLWIGHKSGLLMVDSSILKRFYERLVKNPEHNPFHKGFYPKNILKENYYDRPSVENICEIDSQVWVCTNKMMFRFNKNDNSKKLYKETGKPGDLIHKYVRFVTKVNDEKYLVGTDRGVAWFNPVTDRFTHIHFDIGTGNIDNKGFYSGSVDNQGNIWMVYSEGVINASNQKGAYPFNLLEESFSNNSKSPIKEIFIDRLGTVWIGSKYNGLYILNKEPVFPNNNIQIASSTTGSNFCHITACEQDKEENIWVGTKFNGLLLLDTENSVYQEYFNYNSEKEKKILKRIEDVVEIDDGKLIAGSSKGLGVFNVKTKQVHVLTFHSVRSIFKDRKNNIWLGSDKGIYLFDIENKRPYQKANNRSSPFFLDNDLHVTCITEDLKGLIYFGTREKGLFIYDPVQETVYQKELNYQGWHGVMIRDIINGNDSSVWIATKHTGLFYYNYSRDQLSHYDQSKGLASNTIYSLVFDDHGDLWAGTHQGLSKLSVENGHFNNFNINHGLINNIFESKAKAHLYSGEMIFGGHSGLNLFHPDSITLQKKNAPLIISNIKINNNLFLSDVVTDTTIYLSHHHNYVTFDFTYLDYRLPQANTYRFKLEGIDNEWISSNIQNEVTYPALKHGSYVFKIKAMGLDNNWSKPLNVRIVIKPPIWSTKIAFVIYCVLIFSIVWIIINITKQRLYFKGRIKEAYDKVESTVALNKTKLLFFTNISHELRTPLSLIIAPLENLLNKKSLSKEDNQQVELIARNAKKLNYLVNQLLYFRKTEQTVADMKICKGDLVAFVKEILFPYYQLAAGEKIIFNIISDQDQIELWFDPDKVEKILNNLLMNAFKYTSKGGSIVVELHIDKMPKEGRVAKSIRRNNQLANGVCLSVKDTGMGMSKEETRNIFERFFVGDENKNGIGMGLDLAKMLVEMHGGAISVDSEPGKGSTFKVWFRLGKDHFDKKYISNNEIKVSEYVRQIDEDILEIDKGGDLSTNIKTHKKSYRILIVEDNYDMRYFLELNLAEEYDLLMAENGKDGLKLAFEETPDLIISDIMMPEMDGIEMSSIIKSDISTSHIPIILLTAKTQLENKLEGMAIGADDYIEKPFSIKILDLKIKNVLRTREKLKQQVLSQLSKGSEINAGISGYDKQFLKKCTEAISKNYGDPKFNVVELSKMVNMSRSQLHRKLKSLVDKTPIEWIYDHRLEMARELLNNNRFNVTDVAYMTGFNSPSSFSTVFKKKYKVAPSVLIHKKDKNNSE